MASWRRGLRRILRPHAGSVRSGMSSVSPLQGLERAAKRDCHFAIPALAAVCARNSQFYGLLPSGGFWFLTCLHMERAFLLSTSQELLQYLSPCPLKDKSLWLCYYVELSVITLFEDKPLIQFIHLFNTLFWRLITCHLHALGNWDALVQNGQESLPSGSLHCSKGKQ